MGQYPPPPDYNPPPPPPYYQAAQHGRHLGKADDQLVVSILVMLFCCQPLGIASIVFSAMTMSANNAGNFDQAHRHANLAKKFNMWAIILGLVYVGAILFFVVLSIAAGAAA